MFKTEYKKIDAFTGRNSLGNPAAGLILGDKKLSDEEMLQIGKEHSGFVSEVVFVNDSDAADCKLTYFSSECEVEFCGHGTIATMYEFIKNNPALMEKDEVRIETNRKGILTVYNELETEDKNCIAHTRVFAPKFGNLEDPATGSSNSAFARYLLKNNLWNGTAACLEQGGPIDHRQFVC